MLEADLLLAFRKRGRRQENSGHKNRNGGFEHGAVSSESEVPSSWLGRKLLPQHDVTPTRRLPGCCPPLGHVAFLVQPRRRLHRYNCHAATASPAARRAHLLSFSSKPRIVRALGRPASRPHPCPRIEDFGE